VDGGVAVLLGPSGPGGANRERVAADLHVGLFGRGQGGTGSDHRVLRCHSRLGWVKPFLVSTPARRAVGCRAGRPTA
jgi:hypothetical protein